MIAKNKPISEEAISDARLARMHQAVDQVRENIVTRGAWVNLLAGARGLVAAGEYVEACFILDTMSAIALGWWCRCSIGKSIQHGKTAEDMLNKLWSSQSIDKDTRGAILGVLRRTQLDAVKAQGLLDLLNLAQEAIGDIHLDMVAKRSREEARGLYRGFSDPSDRAERRLMEHQLVSVLYT